MYLKAQFTPQLYLFIFETQIKIFQWNLRVCWISIYPKMSWFKKCIYIAISIKLFNLWSSKQKQSLYMMNRFNEGFSNQISHRQINHACMTHKDKPHWSSRIKKHVLTSIYHNWCPLCMCIDQCLYVNEAEIKIFKWRDRNIKGLNKNIFICVLSINKSYRFGMT